MKRTLIIKLAVVLGLLATAVGCMVQPVNPDTGETVGEPQSTTVPLPPGTVGEPTDEIDYDRIAQDAPGVGGLFGPWGTVAGIAVGAAAATYAQKRRQRKAKE